MASFGAKYPRFSPITSEPEGALPVYSGPVSLGRLVKAELTPTLSQGKLYGDDGLAESVDEFSSASIALETDDIADEVAAVVYGATVADKKVSYKAGDAAPLGGLAYYKVLMRDGIKMYKGYFYPRVKAQLGTDLAQTKADAVTFGTAATTFTVFAANTDEWRITQEFKTEAEVQAWVDEQLAAPPVQG